MEYNDIGINDIGINDIIFNDIFNDIFMAPKGYTKDGKPRKRLPKKTTPEHIKNTEKYKKRRESNNKAARLYRAKKKALKPKQKTLKCKCNNKNCIYIKKNEKLKETIKELNIKVNKMVEEVITKNQYSQ
jgi:hypothetical protein